MMALALLASAHGFHVAMRPSSVAPVHAVPSMHFLDDAMKSWIKATSARDNGRADRLEEDELADALDTAAAPAETADDSELFALVLRAQCAAGAALPQHSSCFTVIHGELQ